MNRRRNKRTLKKSLRRQEAQLGKSLIAFLKQFDPQRSLEDEHNFQELLGLRWLVNNFVYFRLKLHPAWSGRQWFLDLLDVDGVTITKDGVTLLGDVVWWAEGTDAVGEWWPADHEARRSGPYKVKLRGDLCGGRWVLEPIRAELSLPRAAKRLAKYRVEFGHGSTRMVITGGR